MIVIFPWYFSPEYMYMHICTKLELKLLLNRTCCEDDFMSPHKNQN